MRTRRREEMLLRALIREYRVSTTNLSPLYSRDSGKESSLARVITPGRALVGLALYGTYKLYGNIKSAWESFSTGLSDVLKGAGISAATDIITGVVGLEEGIESKFKTAFGEIVSDLIDSVLLGNADKASKQDYISEANTPLEYNIAKPQDFVNKATGIARQVSDIRAKLENAVNRTPDDFPQNLVGVVPDLEGIEKIDDLEVPLEQTAAKKAMTDMVATAVYAKMQKEVTDKYFEVIIKDLEAKVKKGEVTSDQYEKFKKDALKPAIDKVGEAGKLSGRALEVLVPK